MTHVFLISRCRLLGGGIETLLRQQPGIDIVGSESSVDRALREIGRLHPETVILGDCLPSTDVIPVVARILQVQTDIRVIAMNSQNEVLAVYSGALRPAIDVRGLVAAITGDSLPGRDGLIDQAA